MDVDSSKHSDARSSRAKRHPLEQQARQSRSGYARLGTQSRRCGVSVLA